MASVLHKQAILPTAKMSKMDFQIPRQASTIRTMVEDKVRSAILSGHFKPGQRLVERELCELIGVGRTSIREALRQLEAEGLVQTIPHRGPVVATMEYEEAEQLYAIRALLEGYAGQQFAERGTPEQMKQLDAAVAALEDAVRNPDQKQLLDAKNLFYSTLMDGSGNIFVRQTLTLLHNRINILRATSMMQEGRLEHSMSEIRDIQSAIKQRDGARAAAACRYHIESAARAALSMLRKEI